MNESSQSPGGGDRALLEAAAKAYWGAEIDDVVSVEWSDEDSCIAYTHGDNQDHNGRDVTLLWTPLTDSGQALDLAAHLRLKVLPGKHKGDGCTVESQQPGIAGCTAFRDDPAEQMRFAIVFVAAEIGAAMASERGRG